MQAVRLGVLALAMMFATPAVSLAQQPEQILSRLIYLLRADAEDLHDRLSVTQKGAGTTVMLDKKRFLELMATARANYKNYDVRDLVVKTAATSAGAQDLSYSYRYWLTLNGQKFKGQVRGLARFVKTGDRWQLLKDEGVSTLTKDE